MVLLQRLRFWWSDTGARTTQGKASPDLRPISVEALTEDLRLIQQAKRLGEAGIPPADAVSATGPEAVAIQRVEKVRQDYVDWAVRRLAAIHDTLERYDITADVNRARQADQEFVRKASTALSERESLLRSLGEAAQSARRELIAFKTRNRIEREADYPEGVSVFLRWAFLGFLIVVEGLLNSVFFAQGLDSGLIGGAFYAMSLAALNVAVAYVIGRFGLRLVFHRSVVLKCLGTASFLAAAAAAVTMGLAIAHFRDALTAESANAGVVALEALKASPLSLRDLTSWGLFGISLAFAVAALADGLFADDLYPSFGAVTRKSKQTQADYEAELEEVRSELEALKDEAVESLDETLAQARASVTRYANELQSKRDTKTRLYTSVRDVDHSLDALLKSFRTENEMHRQGIRRPAYFDEPLQLKQLRFPDFSTDQEEGRLRDQREKLDMLQNEVESIRSKIQAAFNQQFDRLRPLDSHFLESEQGGR